MQRPKLTKTRDAAAVAAEGPDGVACALGSLYMSGEVRECFRNGKE